MIQLTKIVLKQTTHHVSAFKHLHGVYMVCTQFFDSYSGFKCYPITTFYSHQTVQSTAIQTLLFSYLVFKKLSKHYFLVIRHLVHCYPNTSFKFSDIQFKAIQTLSFNQLCLVYSHLSCHFFMSIVSLLLSNDQFLTMSMMSLLTKSYLKTSFLAYEKLVLLYLMYIQKLTIGAT